jgi:hypothetical protein
MFPKLLQRDIILLLCAKAAALALIYCIFIAPSVKPEPDRVAMRAHLLGDPSR